MHWTEKNKVVIDVEWSVMVQSEAEGRMNMFEVSYIACNAQVICNCSFRAHWTRTRQIHGWNKVHSIVEDKFMVRLSTSTPQANECNGYVDGDEWSPFVCFDRACSLVSKVFGNWPEPRGRWGVADDLAYTSQSLRCVKLLSAFLDWRKGLLTSL